MEVNLEIVETASVDIIGANGIYILNTSYKKNFYPKALLDSPNLLSEVLLMFFTLNSPGEEEPLLRRMHILENCHHIFTLKLQF